MKQAKGTLIGTRSVRLAYGTWLPDAEPRAVVVLVHGMHEHMGRYVHVIDALTQHGYAVYGQDHRGHGESQGVRGFVERFDYLVDDLHLLVSKAHTTHPQLPLFMVGHSMGGLIAVRYALQHQANLTGLIVSGTAIQFGDHVSPWIKRMSAMLATLLPRLPITASHAEVESVLSRDPAVQLGWDNDPLCYQGKVRARLGHEFLKAAMDTRLRVGQLRLPLLVMHGTADKLADPSGSQVLYDAVQSSDKTLKLWNESRHEIFNELDKAEVIAFMLRWLDQRVTREQADVLATQLI